jgi:hypothetical protein
VKTKSSHTYALDVIEAQVAPTSPRGIVKSNIASLVVPEFTTVASVQGAPVVVVQASAVALSQVSPFKSLLSAFFVVSVAQST